MWRTDKGVHIFNISAQMFSLTISGVVMIVIPLDNSTECILFLTKIPLPFGYIFMYMVMLPVSLHALSCYVAIFKITRKHLLQESTKTDEEIALNKKKHNNLLLRFIYHSAWTVFSWFSLFAIIQLHFLRPDLISNLTLCLIFMFLMLLLSSYSIVFFVMSKSFRLKLRQALATYDHLRCLADTRVHVIDVATTTRKI